MDETPRKETGTVIRRLLSSILIGFVFAIGLGVIGYYFVLPRILGINAVREREQQLAYQLDAQSVLQACDELMARTSAMTSTRPATQPVTLKEIEQNLPPAIQILKPSFVAPTRDRLVLEFGGGFYHFGLYAYAVGAKQSRTKQIIDRLWFYNEANKVPERSN